MIGCIWPTELNSTFKSIQTWVVARTGWIYVLGVGTILFASLWLMVSRLGDIKLGPDHSEPDYTNLSWFSMLFSAGMGIGLMFWGVAEPVMHFNAPPTGDPASIASAKEALKITFFHWGLHAWAIYAILAVVLAYFCYRKRLPLLPRSAFYPLIGDRIHGKIGDVIDTFAVIGTMFGVATSLGLGVAQVNAGLGYLFDLPVNSTVQVVLIAAITGLATISVVLGLDGGIKKLSNINVVLAVLLMGFILVAGNTVDLLQAYVQNTGSYLSDIIYKTFNLYAYEKKSSWIGGWTLLYWAWWISWSPFVGMFIARISRGRTIREFMIGVLFVPTGFTFLWMTVFGNSAIDQILNQGRQGLLESVNSNVPVALFRFLETFPASSVLSMLSLCLVVTFFVSSSDSGSLVIDTLTSGGHQEPPVWQRIFWAVTEGLVAAVLLLAGGLEALQTMTIISAFPILLMILVSIYTLSKSLKADYMLMNSVQTHTTTLQYSQAPKSWRQRLDVLTSHPRKDEAKKFLRDRVIPALAEFSEELDQRGIKADLASNPSEYALITIRNEDVEDFRYEVRLRAFEVPGYSPEESSSFYRAEVFLQSGGQEYDIFGYTKEQVAADAVTQYEKHYHFLHMANSETFDPT